IESARPKLEMSTVAPCSCATLAAAKPIELSIVTPATRIRLPSRRPISVPHSQSAVDRDHGPGDVARVREPGDGAGDLVDARVPAQGDLGLDRALLLVGEDGRQVGLDEARGHDVGRAPAAAQLTGERPGQADEARL